jgi:hypothetical protein
LRAKRPKHAEEQVQRWYHWWQTDGQGVRRCFAFTRYYCAVKRRTQDTQDTNLGNFNDDQIADWLLLLETLLGWVQWLKSEKMQVKHVDASSGNIDISCSWSKVIRRTEGGDEVQQIPFNFAHHK